MPTARYHLPSQEMNKYHVVPSFFNKTWPSAARYTSVPHQKLLPFEFAEQYNLPWARHNRVQRFTIFLRQEMTEYRVVPSQLTQNISLTLVRHCINVVQMFCVHWDHPSVRHVRSHPVEDRWTCRRDCIPNIVFKQQIRFTINVTEP